MCEIVYGIHVIESILYKNPDRFLEVYIINNYNTRLKKLVYFLQKYDILIKFVNKKFLYNIVKYYGVHQGIVAKIKKNVFKNDIFSFVSSRSRSLLLVLDGITDSRNLGACFRNAEAAGVDAIIVPKHRSAKLNAIAKKSSSGSSELVPFFRVNNLSRVLNFLKSCNFWIIGTSSNSNHSLYNAKVDSDSLVLILGSEDKGMRFLTSKYCNEIVSVPMFGLISSLNVSVVSGICLFEFIRKRKYK
ncbi:MAG: 23S rRNA 2'-O-ribose methyltransferase [Candidatus Westeberhardia cardiocondylae]|nr:23S rRNA 2'-O-ribose methyltransferase [Candidatus Westeberhardia cardiocondylae]